MILRRRAPGRGAAPLSGRIPVPGDKSISHRALLIAALARGRSRALGINLGADVRATASAVAALGTAVDIDEANRVIEVDSNGAGRLQEPSDVIDCGNSGTTIRMLLGLCAGLEGITVLTGDASLRRRPMLRVVAPLRQMGATVDGRDYGDRAPLAVRGGDLVGCEIELAVASAQVKSALLLAGLQASGTTSVTEPSRSRDHTERMLRASGVEVAQRGLTVTITGGVRPEPADRTVPGDMSSAMFLVAAALLVPGSDLVVTDVGLNPTRRAALDLVRAMGGAIETSEERDLSGEPVGDVRVRHSELRAVAPEPSLVASFVDEIPVLAVLATQAEGETVISGAAELRVKESDRVVGIVQGLRRLGADVDELEDGLVIRGPTELRGGEVDSRGDHRLALAFAVAGLVASDRVRVAGWSCVEVSFPNFLEVLARAQGLRR